MKNKKRLLIMTDSYTVYTGFANIGRHFSQYIHSLDEYEIAYLCWFYAPINNLKPPFRIYTTLIDHTKCCGRGPVVMRQDPEKNPVYFKHQQGVLLPINEGQTCFNGSHMDHDKYGYESVHGVILDFKPDIVWSIGDQWMNFHVTLLSLKPCFKFIQYFPIDGSPMPYNTSMGAININWVDTIDKVDKPITFCDFSRDTVIKTGELYGKDLKKTGVIYHGIDLDVYKPLQNKVALRKKWFPNIPENIFLVGFFSRNQPRKAVHKLMEALALGKRKGYWSGDNLKAYFHCLTDGNMIKTNTGLKNISDIEVGDEVLTKGNTYNKVVANKSRLYSGSLHSIITAATNIPIESTAEHRFPIIPVKKCSLKWKNGINCYDGCKEEGRKQLCDSYYKDYKEDITFAKDIKSGDYMIYPINRQIDSNVIKSEYYDDIIIDKDFMRLLGYYLSDGSATIHGCIRFDFSHDQIDFANDVNNIMFNKFNLKGKIFNQGNCLRIRFCSTKLALFLRNFVGFGSGNKFIPQQIINQSDEYLYEILNGLWKGDGCYTDRFKYTTISKSLAYDVWTILIRTGFIATLYRQQNRDDYETGFKHKAEYTYNVNIARISSKSFCEKCYSDIINHNDLGDYIKNNYEMIIKNDYLYIQVRDNTCRSVSDIEVYNFEVEEDHTYVVTCCISMNCPILDVGWTIPDLITTHDIKDIVITRDLKVGVGPTDAEMNELYNCCDLTTIPTRGEGWGLGFSESMSAGIPVLMSAYSAHHDWADHAAARIKIAALDAEPLTNINRAIVDVDDYCEKIKAFYDDISIEEFEQKFGKIKSYKDEKECQL